MGANHFSKTIVGVDHTAVQALVVSWLRARGLELQDGEPLTQLDREREHGIRLAWSGDRVVVLNSRLETSERLLFELRKLDAPILDYWMHDSDIWGYQLWVDHAVVSAFNSNPSYFGPAEAALGPNDVQALCEVFGIQGQEDAVTRLQRKRALFAEGTSSRLVQLLGVGAAASQYGYVEEEGWPPAGFESETLWFRQVDWDPMQGFDIAALRFEVREPPPGMVRDPGSPDDGGWDPTSAFYGALFGGLNVVSKVGGVVLRPLLRWQQKRWLKHFEEQAAQGKAPWMAGLSTLPQAFELDGTHLHNPQHGLHLELPASATVGPHDNVRMQPSQVFAFQLGPCRVACTAMMPMMARNLQRIGGPGSSLVQEQWSAGPLAVRVIIHHYMAPPMPGAAEAEPGWQLLALLAGPRAVYNISAMGRGPLDDAFVADLRLAVQSIRFD